MKSINNKKRRASRENRMKKRVLRFSAALIIFVAAVTAVIIIGRSPVRTNAADKGTGTKYYKSIVIQNGDTLWSIADRYMESSMYTDQREYVSEIKSINNLKSDNITYGEHLIVSYYVFD